MMENNIPGEIVVNQHVIQLDQPGNQPGNQPNQLNRDNNSVNILTIEERLSDIRVEHKKMSETYINNITIFALVIISVLTTPLIVCNFYYYNKIRNDKCMLEYNKELLSTYFLVFGIVVSISAGLSIMAMILIIFQLCNSLFTDENNVNKMKFFSRIIDLALFGYHIAFFVYFAGNMSRTGGTQSIYEDLNKCYNDSNNGGISEMSSYCIVMFIFSCINFIAKIFKKK